MVDNERFVEALEKILKNQEPSSTAVGCWDRKAEAVRQLQQTFQYREISCRCQRC